MSDWLLQGVDPRASNGKEFYLHTADEWFDIVAIVDQALHPLFPLAHNNPLGWLEDRECLRLADHLEYFLTSGIAATYLRRNTAFRDSRSRTLENLRTFVRFLQSCGGYLADCA